MYRNIRVLASSRTPVEFHRASLLMDQELLQEAIEAMLRESTKCLKCGEQWIWGYYCDRHLEKYGEEFGPDIIPDWDAPPKPERRDLSEAENEELLKALVLLTPPDPLPEDLAWVPPKTRRVRRKR